MRRLFLLAIAVCLSQSQSCTDSFAVRKNGATHLSIDSAGTTSFHSGKVAIGTDGFTLTNSKTSAGSPSLFRSAVVGTDGLALLPLFDSVNRQLVVVHCSNVRCSASTNYVVDWDTSVGQWSGLALGGDGLGLISYYDQTNTALKVAHCRDVECTSADVATLDAPNDVGSYNSITRVSDNLGLISYYDATARDLKVAKCLNARCSQATITTVDSAGDVGSWSAIATGADGNGIISYFDATNNRLKVAHCTNVNCTTSVTSTIDSTGTVGTHSSIAVGSDGFGIVSYYASDTKSLKVAKCSNADCSAASIVTVDVGGGGQYSSIAMGTDNLAIISYNNPDTASLKIARCSNSGCNPATTSFAANRTGAYTALTIVNSVPLIFFIDQSRGALQAASCTDIGCSVISFNNISCCGKSVLTISRGLKDVFSVNEVGDIQFLEGTAMNSLLARLRGLDAITRRLYALTTVGLVKSFPDIRLDPPTTEQWVNMATRTLTFTKQLTDSNLEVTYQDTIGFLMSGQHTTACAWRLLMDGTQFGNIYYHHSSTTTGWRIWGSSLKWTGSAAPGTHTFQMQWYLAPGAASCLAGWVQPAENFLMAREFLQY